MTLHDEIALMGKQALAASRELAKLGKAKKALILHGMADELHRRRVSIQQQNQLDIDAGTHSGLSKALLDRLLLNDKRIDAMIQGLRDVAGLPDPIGKRLARVVRPNGLVIIKKRVPIGVIAIIYESRPNVTADTAGLCVKSGNAVILRGGKEAFHSNVAVADALIEGGRAKGLPDYSVQLVRTTDRDAVRELVQLNGVVDLVIPRGGETLINAVAEEATVPVIKHYKGVCHVFVDATADLAMAQAIVENAKCQRPGVCNAMETLLVHEKIAETFLPAISARLRQLGVELRGDSASRSIVSGMNEATEKDWSTEYLDLILSVRVVPSVQAAIEHINTFGSHHSDAIISASKANQNRFLQEVDSAAVYVNASTRFTDGAEFGLGAEMGISTDKIHARGPMAVEELTTYKWIGLGSGQVRG